MERLPDVLEANCGVDCPKCKSPGISPLVATVFSPESRLQDQSDTPSDSETKTKIKKPLVTLSKIPAGLLSLPSSAAGVGVLVKPAGTPAPETAPASSSSHSGWVKAQGKWLTSHFETHSANCFLFLPPTTSPFKLQKWLQEGDQEEHGEHEEQEEQDYFDLKLTIGLCSKTLLNQPGAVEWSATAPLREGPLSAGKWKQWIVTNPPSSEPGFPNQPGTRRLIFVVAQTPETPETIWSVALSPAFSTLSTISSTLKPIGVVQRPNGINILLVQGFDGYFETLANANVVQVSITGERKVVWELKELSPFLLHRLRLGSADSFSIFLSPDALELWVKTDNLEPLSSWNRYSRTSHCKTFVPYHETLEPPSLRIPLRFPLSGESLLVHGESSSSFPTDSRLALTRASISAFYVHRGKWIFGVTPPRTPNLETEQKLYVVVYSAHDGVPLVALPYDWEGPWTSFNAQGYFFIEVFSRPPHLKESKHKDKDKHKQPAQGQEEEIVIIKFGNFPPRIYDFQGNSIASRSCLDALRDCSLLQHGDILYVLQDSGLRRCQSSSFARHVCLA